MALFEKDLCAQPYFVKLRMRNIISFLCLRKRLLDGGCFQDSSPRSRSVQLPGSCCGPNILSLGNIILLHIAKFISFSIDPSVDRGRGHRSAPGMATALFHLDVVYAEEVSIVQAGVLLPSKILGMSRVGDAVKDALTRSLWPALSECCKRGKTDADDARREFRRTASCQRQSNGRECRLTYAQRRISG